LRRIRAAGTPFHQAVATQLERYPRFRSQGWTNLHDPLAVAALIRPDVLEFTPVHLDVELAGKYTAGATLMRTPTSDFPTNVQAGLRVNVSAFEAFFVERAASKG
jgi:inosine-uridine nucleoside N-ribohydrolase